LKSAQTDRLLKQVLRQLKLLSSHFMTSFVTSLTITGVDLTLITSGRM